MVILTESKRQNMNRNSSKGNQLKWFADGVWYKADYLGYEALAEYLVSHLLGKTTVPKYVTYEVVPIEYNGNQYNGCKSDNFLKEGQELQTLLKLFRKNMGIELHEKIAKMQVHERISFVVENVKKMTGLEKFGEYLTMLLELDAIFLNEDRHLNNIAVLQNEDRTFDYCPVFDNGAALFSDTTISFPMERTIQSCYECIEAKPFNRSFEEQMFAAEDLYGVQLSVWFDEKDIEKYLKPVQNIYGEAVMKRITEVLREQLFKYKYLQTKRIF